MWLITGIGNTVEHITDLKFAYKTAKFCSELHYFNQEEIIRYGEIDRNFNNSFEDYNYKYKELINSILIREENWAQKLDEVLEIIENLHYGNRYAAENRCIAMAMDLYSELEECRVVSEEDRKEYDAMVARIRNQSSYEELKNL